ncbi:MAG: hypothetical protein Q9182_007505, partial [Xanthomendoza sp. 2 TL-2023]
ILRSKNFTHTFPLVNTLVPLSEDSLSLHRAVVHRLQSLLATQRACQHRYLETLAPASRTPEQRAWASIWIADISGLQKHVQGWRVELDCVQRKRAKIAKKLGWRNDRSISL